MFVAGQFIAIQLLEKIQLRALRFLVETGIFDVGDAWSFFGLTATAVAAAADTTAEYRGRGVGDE